MTPDTVCPGRLPPAGSIPPAADIRAEAGDFLRTCLTEPDAGPMPTGRWDEIASEIDRTGTYHQTSAELGYGSKLAWRNSLDCIGKGAWRGLVVRDCREAVTPDQIYDACVEHLRIATGNGRIKAVMTVLPSAAGQSSGIRIWNSQLIQYAGYRNSDGSVTGDPDTVRFTEAVRDLGWRGKGTRFDILPLVIQVPGEPIRWYPLPESTVLEVPLSHPELSWFGELELRWYAHPAISNQLLRIGGVSYPAAPFSGWYTCTEVAIRNLGSPLRYNVLPEIGRRLGLDTRTTRTLWRDRAAVELMCAVMHSFTEQRVTIVDHHSVATAFAHHQRREDAAGRATRARWRSLAGAAGDSAHALLAGEYDESIVLPNFFGQPALGDPPISSP